MKKSENRYLFCIPILQAHIMNIKSLFILSFIFSLCGICHVQAQVGVDTSGPTFVNFPTDQLEYCETADYQAWLASQRAFASAEDDGCGLLSITDDAPPDFTKDCGSVFIVFTATDSCGNTTPWGVIYEVRDTVAPSFIQPADTIVVPCQAVPNPVLPKVDDNCDSSLITFFEETLIENGCGGEEVRRRRWIAADNCGNSDTVWQIVVLVDTTAPVISGVPGDTVVSCDQIPQPPVIGTDLTATDVCEGILTISFLEFTSQNPDADSCGHFSYTLTRRWIARDDCGNTSIDTQLIKVVDTTAPLILTIPDITVDCQFANIPDSTGIPDVEENCDTSYRLSYSDVLQVGSCPQQYTIRRTWSTIDACGNTDSALQLIVVRDTAPPFVVTNPLSPTLTCSGPEQVDSTFGEWLDSLGYAEFSDLCGFVTGFAAVPGSYTPDDPATWPGEHPATLDTLPCTGMSSEPIRRETVDFVFLDECGNATVSTATFTVSDTTPPAISVCPPDITIFTMEDACDAFFVPMPPEAIDACTQTFFAYTSDGTDTLPFDPSQSPNPLLLTEGMHEITLFATDCSGNRSSCTHLVEIVDNQTPSIVCPPDQTISFPPDQDCNQGFEIRIAAPVSTDNCQLTEGTYFSQGASQISGTFLPDADSLSVILNSGQTVLNFTANDLNGLSDSCQVLIELIDGQAPNAICQPVEIEINPSGLTPYILTPVQIDGGSTDNCGIVSFSLSHDTLTCNQAPGLITVTLTAADAQGNTATCESLVKISTIQPEPSYLNGLCGGDTLELFANPPVSPVPSSIAFDFMWSGPQSFNSTLENPKRPSVTAMASGTYGLTVTGTTGCTASQTVEVVITEQPAPPVLNIAEASICIGEAAVLQTSPYSGSTVSYCWYQRIGGQDTLIAVTLVPQFTVEDLPAGTWTYAVEVKRNGCASGLSAPASVQVNNPPIAITNDAVILRCEGESFNLGTPVIGPGYTYQWIGPGFFSALAVPPEQTNIKPSQSGTYELVIFLDGCPSDPAFTQVEITPSPPQPDLASNGPVCQGDELTIFTDLTDGQLYSWKTPNLGTLTTTEPVLSIPSAAAANNGEWEVVVTIDGCESPPSEAVFVTVNPIPAINATNNGPGCAGGDVQLSASDFPGAAYFWTGPSGFQSTQKDPLATAQSGWYVVTATTPPGCTDTDSTLVVVNQPPVITGGSASPQGCVSGDQDVVLNATIFPPDNGTYQYNWSGPTSPVSSGPQAIIPDATGDDAGPYVLVVTDSFGCESAPFSIPVDLTDSPVTPSLQPTGPLSRCAGESVTISTGTSYTGSVTYIWNTPAGTINTSIPSLTINTLQPALHTGAYSLMVIRNGCPSNTSGEVVLTVHEIPDAPTAGAVSNKVCTGDTLQLLTTFKPGLQYEWTGPSGFAAQTANPVRYPALPIHEGSYAVRVTENGCTSPYSAFVAISILDLPSPPLIQQNGPLCIDEPGAQLSLTVSNAPSGATFQWFDSNADTVIGGPSPATTLLLGTGQLPGPGGWSVYAQTTSSDGCLSDPSVPVVVQLDAIPALSAFAGDNLALCELMSVTLQAQPPSTGTGSWSQAGGPPITINNPGQAASVVSNLENGEIYTLVWSLSNGACLNYSSDTLEIRVDSENELSEAGALIKICDSSTVLLEASPSAFGNTGFWSQSQEQIAQGIAISDPASPNSEVTGLLPGNIYVFTWTLSNPGCGDISSDAVQVRVGDASENAFAGPDSDVCEERDATLNAQPPLRSIGQWIALNPGVSVSSPSSPSSSVNGLLEGENRFVWFLTNDGCPIFSRDTASIFFFPVPEAVDDIISTSFSTSSEIDVLANDLLPDAGFEIELVSSTAFGELDRIGIGSWEYRPAGNFFGEDQFVYQLCSPICPGLCTQGIVRIVVAEGNDCTPPSIITPNNDGINDAFIVPCLSSGNYPDNTVVIFNQWGDELYRANPYNNDWQGTFDGQVLPASTYFYHVDYGDGSAPASGFLMIER